jgi:protease I
MAELSDKKVAVLTTNGVEEAELKQPVQALREAGATVRVFSIDGGSVQMMKHDEKSDTVQSDGRISEAQPDDFDAVLLPGGALNADKLRMDEDARNFVRRIDNQGKPIAAICHAPWLLISAGLAGNRTLTTYYTLQDDVRNAGGIWLDREVNVDGNLITSRFPGDIPAFNQKIIETLSRVPASPR